MIWIKEFAVEDLNKLGKNSCSDYFGIEFIEIGDDYLKAKMPVNEKTKQPFGILHGGASCVLAETIGSIASSLCVDDPYKERPVGIEINANHLRMATEGFVFAVCKPIKIGRKLHVWNIEISDANDKMICVSRLTVMMANDKYTITN